MSTILIVDDNASARETLVAMLETQEYHIELAEDGFHALQILHHLQPDLILLDVMMPGMDGFEVCRRIRAAPACRGAHHHAHCPGRPRLSLAGY